MFFQKGLIVATLSGALLGFIGVYIVLRGMSYIGHGLSHAIFGGYAAMQLFAAQFYVLGAGIWGIASAIAITSVARRGQVGADAAIGVITTASFALGVALFSKFGSSGPAFDNALFGSILGITNSQIIWLLLVMVFAGLVVLLRYRELLFTTFDPDVAQASGIKVARVEALLMIVLALSILVTLNVIGVTEYFYNTRNFISRSYAGLEGYIPLALGYLVLTLPVAWLAHWLEKRFRHET